MNEEPQIPIGESGETHSEPVDIYERRTYHVIISGDNVMIPIDRFVELPTYLAEGFLEAGREATQTAGQQALREELTTYLDEQFSGIADGDLTPGDITLQPVSDTDENPTL